MALKVFSKKHPELAKEISLRKSVCRRIWYIFKEYDPYYDSNSVNDSYTLCWDELPSRLIQEHGWQKLPTYKSQSKGETGSSMEVFILCSVPKYVLDATELYYDLLVEHKKSEFRSSSDPTEYQSRLNSVFDDANLPWRMLEGRIIRIDSKWLEAEIHAKAAELLSACGFEGALLEFLNARSDLSSGDYKGAIRAANLALESSMKAILGIDKEKPGGLIRKLIDSGIVPEYHEGFINAFEEHILRAVPIARNQEKGVGHGQGSEISEPPSSLAELAVNLSGVLILYLLKRHLELHPIDKRQESESEVQEGWEDALPF